MNIAIMLPSLSGGGAERVASIVGDYYVEKGHCVYYFLGNYGLRNRYKVKGKIVKTDINFVIGKESGNIVNLIRSAIKMKKLKKEYNIDVAISFMEEFNYINILSKGREKVIIRVCRILSKSTGNISSIWLNRYLLGFIYNMADNIIVMSNYAVKDMRQTYGIRKDKLCKIPNPVSHYNDNLNQEIPTWEYGDKTILCVGRCVDEKQQNVSVKAFKRVCENDYEVQLIFLGEGYNQGKLEKMIDTSGIKDRIHYLGFQQDIYYFMKHSKIFLMNSKAEGFPNAMLEAMNAGMAIVTTDCPGGPADIVGKSKKNKKYCPFGILTPYIDDDSYDITDISKEEIELGDTLLELIQDNEMLSRYRSSSLNRSNKYQIGNIMKQWNRIVLK